MALFFSQRDNQWAGDQMGNCGITLGTHGCAVAAAAMLLTSFGVNVDPQTLNMFLGSNAGYAPGCLIRWDVAAAFDAAKGVQFLHKGLLESPLAIRDGLQQGKRIIAASVRFAPATHFVYVVRCEPSNQLGWNDFIYWDPWDDQETEHRIGDGRVNGGNSTRVFQ